MRGKLTSLDEDLHVGGIEDEVRLVMKMTLVRFEVE